MRTFLRIIASILVVSVFSANSMKWLGGWYRKKSKKVVVTQEFAMDDMIKGGGELATKVGLCPIELENESRYDRSIYEVGATIDQRAELASEYLKKFTKIVLDSCQFNKKKGDKKLLKVFSVPILEQTIKYCAQQRASLKNDSAFVAFLRAVKKSLPYYEPSWGYLLDRAIGVSSEGLLGHVFSFNDENKTFLVERFGDWIPGGYKYRPGDEKDMIFKQFKKSKKDHKKLKKLVAQGLKNWKKRKK